MNYSFAFLFRLLFLLIILTPGISFADMIIGGETNYVVQQGDCLISIGAKLGVGWQNIVKQNQLDVAARLKIGTPLMVNTLRIVPKTVADGIIINIPEGMLYFFKNGELTALPVGPGKSDRKWQTPLGRFIITAKAKNPTWHVPLSIQEEMEMNGQPIETLVEPGPDNPLGKYAFRTSLADILIHATIWPTTVHQWRSHGCIRMLPEHIEKLFPLVAVGTRGEIIYEPVKLAQTSEGRVFLEVHRDIYRKMQSLPGEVKKNIEKRCLSDKVDWNKIGAIVNEKSGIAEDITL
jgi:L,D-transpeptidase ErfK/SrfK